MLSLLFAPPLDAPAILAEAGSPGMMVVRIEGRRTEIAVAGMRRVGGSDPVRRSDRFSLGSMSKSFTALLCARLVDRGVLRWNLTLGEAWPGEVKDAELAKVSLLDLLHHRSGLGGRDANYPAGLPGTAYLAKPEVGRPMLRTAYLSAKPTNPPRAGSSYANANFVLAAMMAESKTGRSWPELIRSEVLNPLRTGDAVRAGVSDPSDGVVGHLQSKEGLKPAPGVHNLPLLWGADGIYASPGGFAKVISAHLAESPRFLRKATWRAIHDPVSGVDAGGMGVAGGLFVLGDSDPAKGWRWHNGSNMLNYGAFLFDPLTKRGAAIVMNVATPRASSVIEGTVRELVRLPSNVRTVRRSY